MNFFVKIGQRLVWALTSEKKRRQKMEDVISLLKFSPEAHSLFLQAQADGVEIAFHPRLIGSKAAGFHGFDKNKKERIDLHPSNSAPDNAISLAHELRHYWQDKRLGLGWNNYHHTRRNPRLSFIFNRVVEADAIAFQQRFAATVNENMENVMELVSALEKIKAGDIGELKKNIADKNELFHLDAARYLRECFEKILSDPRLSDGYDPEEALVIYAWHTATEEKKAKFDDFSNLPEITLKDIRGLLKTGIGENSSGYMDDLSDRDFEALVLRHAHKDARKVVRLMEKFKAASAANDNGAAEKILARVRKKVYSYV